MSIQNPLPWRPPARRAYASERGGQEGAASELLEENYHLALSRFDQAVQIGRQRIDKEIEDDLWGVRNMIGECQFCLGDVAEANRWYVRRRIGTACIYASPLVAKWDNGSNAR